MSSIRDTIYHWGCAQPLDGRKVDYIMVVLEAEFPKAHQELLEDEAWNIRDYFQDSRTESSASRQYENDFYCE